MIGYDMQARPDFIKNCEELISSKTWTYPGDSEIFGTCALLSRKMGLKRVAINLAVLQPGDRSSWPHAHKEEEEFIFIFQGHPQVWVDGRVYDLGPGDCVGFPPGTGHVHTLLNNSENVVLAIVVGETKPVNEKLFYPMHPGRNEEIKEKGFFWQEHPQHEFGHHDGWPDKKRPAK